MQKLKNLKHKLILCAIFAASMAYLESAVVVYVRELYFPGGFLFPIPDFPSLILITEIGREIATIIMLWAIAKMIANNRYEWFAYFSFSFGMWDIWYYLWLKILIDWPGNILEWDLLFLVPLAWTGPVLAPIIVSISLIICGYIILRLLEKNILFQMNKIEWIFEIIAGMIIILSFLVYPDIMTTKIIPDYYPWWLFSIGMLLGLCIFIRNVIRTLK